MMHFILINNDGSAIAAGWCLLFYSESQSLYATQWIHPNNGLAFRNYYDDQLVYVKSQTYKKSIYCNETQEILQLFKYITQHAPAWMHEGNPLPGLLDYPWIKLCNYQLVTNMASKLRLSYNTKFSIDR